MNITIDYNNGNVVPDNKVVSFIQEKLKLNKDFSIGSNILLMALRVEVMEGRYREDYKVEGINEPIVVVEYKGEPYYINKYGKMPFMIPESKLDELLDTLIGI